MADGLSPQILPPSRDAREDLSDDDARAFIVIRHGERTWVTDLERDRVTSLGRGAEAEIRVFAPELAPIHARLRWDGRRVLLTEDAGPTFVNGKPAAKPCELRGGDELGIGSCRMVIGIATSPTHGVRRALTHQEFRERLWAELARAARARRPTTLALMQARTGEGRRLTQVAVGQFRAGDLVGAYAHDEVEVLLPDTDGKTAAGVIERIMKAHGLTVSFGIAVAPEDAEHHERLLRGARAALDHARSQEMTWTTPPPRRKRETVIPTTRDPATRAVLARIEELALLDGACLVNGEVSSGKAVFARLLHDRSRRSSAPFVSITCSASRPGLEHAFHPENGIALKARGGTLFLDEVSDLPLSAQVAARNLIGRFPDIRLIAGTQRTLAGLVERGAFDADLFGTLNSCVVEIPPLRTRHEDILPLAEKFAIEAGARAPLQISPGAIARLRSYPWPGNVLELHNAMDRAVRLANGGEVLAEHLPNECLTMPTGDGALREHVDSVERDAILRALADSNHNQTHAAKRLGISRRALIYKMEKFGLKRPPRRTRRVN